MSEYILEMKNISKRFGGIHALNDVNLQLRRGEVLCLCGENGAGKSTLMKILAGIQQPSEGQIYIDGQPVRIRKPIDSIHYGVSMVQQELIQIEEMTVAENIFVGRYKTKGGFIEEGRINRETKELIDELGIYFDPKSLLKHYSIAQRQLIEILKALSYHASIIVFDEPTAALTIEETEKLYKIIRKLKEDKMAIIMISHRMEDIYAVGDRIQVLKDGCDSGGGMVSEMTVDDIVQLMVGRKMTQQFPEKTNKSGEVILKAENLTNEKVHGVSFELHKGEILGIGGLVGAGRTELLRLLLGIDSGEGSLLLNGEPVEIHSPRDGVQKGIAFLPEDRKDQGLILEQSILQNTILSILKKLSRIGFMNTREEKSVCKEYIEKLRIRCSGSQMAVKMLSGGNQQKVVLGRCLASHPDILLLDEPTRGVDVGAKAEIYKIINDLATVGLSIIVVSSEMTELLGLSDRILVMHEGYLSGELMRGEATEETIMHMSISHDKTANA